MTSTPYNLSGIHDIFWHAYKQNDEIIAFEVTNGRGRFVFMCFFDTRKVSKKMQDTVYIYMANTRHIIDKVMYGSHKLGNYQIYLNDKERQMFKDELQLHQTQGGAAFDFEQFFENLNAAIPTTLPAAVKTNVIRTHWNDVSSVVKKEIPFYEKSVLIGPMRVTGGTPQYRTLSKLYIFTDGNSHTIENLIRELVKRNVTLSWTTPDRQVKPPSLANVIQRVSSM